MNATALRPAPRATNVVLEEREFYAQYEWCLNPILRVQDLFLRLQEEIDRFQKVNPEWQQEECRINVYLFVCAIAATVDDYLVAHVTSLSAIGRKFPRLKCSAEMAERIARTWASTRKSLTDGAVQYWRDDWETCVDLACRILLAGANADGDDLRWLKARTHALAKVPLPDQLLASRMQLISGYRAQDLTHHDVIAMARSYQNAYPASAHGLAVIGLRTAGSYFAPLVKAYLDNEGWKDVVCFAIRPKAGLSIRERQRLRKIARRGLRVLVIDDHPDTGHSLRLMIDILVRAGHKLENIAIAAPQHPAQRDALVLRGGNDRVAGVSLDFNSMFKVRMLAPANVEPLLRSYLNFPVAAGFTLVESQDTACLNGELNAQLAQSFQTRLKRVYDVAISAGKGKSLQRGVGKSVGWGWLGYHAYIAGKRLEGTVPGVLGLRNGILFSSWIEPDGNSNDKPSPSDLAGYVARRGRLLKLSEDPYQYTWHHELAWHKLTVLLRSLYGPYIGRVKSKTLRRVLAKMTPPSPIFVDGAMHPDKWIRIADTWHKIGYEHHGFGNPSLGVVDPAWDLAGAIFEFHLDDEQQAQLVSRYEEESGDTQVRARLPIYCLLYGTVQLAAATYKMKDLKGTDGLHWNFLQLQARKFLTFQLNRFCARWMTLPEHSRWSNRGFFLDLDGVLDTEILGFAHTTAAGVEALSKLHQHGYSVIANTGRSLEHVRDYCRTYRFSGGIAEFGSVFFDAVSQFETVLVTTEELNELDQCGKEIAQLTGVYLDPGYTYSIRAYRFRGGGTVGLEKAELAKIADKFTRLRVYRRGTDSYFLGRGVNKGLAAAAVREKFHFAREQVGAIGDSEPDLPMLSAAARSYAPQNCSQIVKRLSHSLGCRLLSFPAQRGLLQAVTDMTEGLPACSDLSSEAQTHTEHLLFRLLEVADRSGLRQIASILDRRHL